MTIRRISQRPLGPSDLARLAKGRPRVAADRLSTLSRRDALGTISIGLAAVPLLSSCAWLDYRGVRGLVKAAIAFLTIIDENLEKALVLAGLMEDPLAHFGLVNTSNRNQTGVSVVAVGERNLDTGKYTQIGEPVSIYANIKPRHEVDYAVDSSIIPRKEGEFLLHVRTYLDERTGDFRVV